MCDLQKLLRQSLTSSNTTLDLARQWIGDAGANVVAKFLKFNETIDTLKVGNNRIGVEGVMALAHALERNKNVTYISLNSNQMGDAEARILAKSLKLNKSILTLELGYNQILSPGATYIAESLMINRTITRLHLQGNQIGHEGARAIASALKQNNYIRAICLDKTCMKATGAIHIADALKINRSLTWLRIDSNEIGDRGAGAIAEALKINRNIAIISLISNQIGASGAKDIAEALKINQCITDINLNCNEIGNDGSKFIAEAVKINSCIEVIHLDKNNIGDIGAEHLLESIKVNKCITTLTLQENCINSDTMLDIERALNLNKERAKKSRTAGGSLSKQEQFEEQEDKLKEYMSSIKDVILFEVANRNNLFDIDEQSTIKGILDFIRDGNDRLQEHNSKGLLLLGNTGAGKSTLAHLLSGRKLQAIMDDETGALVIDAMQPLKDIVIGHKLASETRIPNKCLLKKQTIWDCPGFNDTDHVQEIANTFYFQKLFDTTDKLKFVLVVPEIALNSAYARGNAFVETLANFIKSFTDFHAIKDSISLVVTQVPQSKSIHHIVKAIDKILTDNQGATDEHRTLINKLKNDGLIHLFHKPSGEGELTLPDLFAKIDALSKYSNVKKEMVNIAISKKAIDCSFHLLSTSSNNLYKILEVIVRAVSNATQCLSPNPLNAFTENYALIKDWLPTLIPYNEYLAKHDKDEDFLELEMLVKLQNVLNADKITSIPEAIIILRQTLDIFAEYAEPGHVQEAIQGYKYCLQQQYESIKFFATVCKVEQSDHAKFAELLSMCHGTTTKNLEHQVNHLTIQESKSDPDYYNKAIDYLEKYPDSDVCKKNIAVAYICLANIADNNGDQQSQLDYYIKAIGVHNQLPKLYQKLGQLFFNQSKYAKAIECYKVINDEFNINSCFEAWLNQDPKNPDIMLKRAEHFDSLCLFEEAKKNYHYAFSLSEDDTFKAMVLGKIGNIMEKIGFEERKFSRANKQEFYNFSLVDEQFISNLHNSVGV